MQQIRRVQSLSLAWASTVWELTQKDSVEGAEVADGKLNCGRAEEEVTDLYPPSGLRGAKTLPIDKLLRTVP